MCLLAESGIQLFFLNFNVQSQIGRQSPVTVQATQQAVFLRAIESEELQLVAGRAHGICNFERLG